MKRLILLLTLAVSGCSGGEKAPESKIVTENLEYQAGDLVMKGLLAYDGNVEGQRPGVLVVHEWWGHNDYARNRAKMLAELGYTALALDMYGDGKQADHPEDAMKFVMEVISTAEGARERFTAALELLKQHETTNPEQMAAIGYCFGGSVVLNMANIGVDLDAVASFHGGLQGIAPAEKDAVKAKILVCNGGADTFVTQEQIAAFRQNLDEAGADYEFVSYEGALHSFTNPMADSFGVKFEMPLGYNESADKQSWQAMQNLFAEVFGAANKN